MTCPRCGNANSVFETRCTRCGAPFSPGTQRGPARGLAERPAVPVEASATGVLPPGGARPFLINPQARFSAVIANAVVAPSVTQAGADHPNGLVSAGSTARRLDAYDTTGSRPGPRKHAPPTERPHLRVAPPSAQPSLFQPGELPPAPVGIQLQPVTGTQRDTLLPRRKPARKRAKSDILPFAQGTLDFLTPTTPPTRQLRTKVEASILCDQRGASPMHRFAATLVDGACTLIATVILCAVFFGTVRQLGVALPANPQAVYWGLGCIWLLVIMTYQTLVTLGGRESLGYYALDLRVMNLDGSIPSRTQLWKRLLASSASAAPLGVGFVWALFDEEQLAWHDHISGTFPAPKSSMVSSFHRS